MNNVPTFTIALYPRCRYYGYMNKGSSMRNQTVREAWERQDAETERRTEIVKDKPAEWLLRLHQLRADGLTFDAAAEQADRESS